MQYCSLQHWMLLPHQTHPQLSIISALAQPLLSFWSISNCPLLFPSSIVGTFQPGRLIFHCHIFLPSHTVQGVLQARIPECVAISFFRGPHFFRTLHGDPTILGALHGMAQSFINLCKPFHHDKAVIHYIYMQWNITQP